MWVNGGRLHGLRHPLSLTPAAVATLADFNPVVDDPRLRIRYWYCTENQNNDGYETEDGGRQYGSQFHRGRRSVRRGLPHALCVFVVAVSMAACDIEIATDVDSVAQTESAPKPNILLIIGDDLGVDRIPMYGVGENPPETPVLASLADSGLLFEQVWSQPTCSPTRATMLTGQFGFRNGVGAPLPGGRIQTPPIPSGSPVEQQLGVRRAITVPWSIVAARQEDPDAYDSIPMGLRADAVTLPALLREGGRGYTTAAIGKWHLADADNGELLHPARVGFDHYSVLMENGPGSYFAWYENVNGELEARTGYTPARKVDDALAWIAAQGEQPWFLWLALNLPHGPQHAPPGRTAALRNPADPAHLDNTPVYMRLMVEEMDAQIGRLLDSLDPAVRDRTIVIFIGDNGTNEFAYDSQSEYDRAKFMLYQQGIHVPLIVAGPGIAQDERVNGLVNTADIFATVLEIAGQDAQMATDGEAVDAVSLVPYFGEPHRESLRTFNYADKFYQIHGIEVGDYAVRNARYKLIGSTAREELYDLQTDPLERNNLLVEGVARNEVTYERLKSLVRTLHDSAGRITPEP